MSKKPRVRPEQVGIPAQAPKPESEAKPPESTVPSEEPKPETPAPETSPAVSPQTAEAPAQPSEPAPSSPPAPEQPVEAPARAEVSLFDLYAILVELRALVHDQHEMLLTFQSAPKATRRAPMLPNGGKVQIMDKLTGETFPSKNGAYQSLLKQGALKELVDKGIFGADPKKNSFGWYALKRAWPDRFEEQPATPKPEGQSEPQKNG